MIRTAINGIVYDVFFNLKMHYKIVNKFTKNGKGNKKK